MRNALIPAGLALVVALAWAPILELPFTGEDLGNNKDAWFAWWRKAKKKFKISPDRPKIPEADQVVWEDFWSEPY